MSDERETLLKTAVWLLNRVVQADRDDATMGYPNAGDSCIGACIGLEVMPFLDRIGALLPKERS